MPYLTLAEVMRRRFGCRVQKLSIDAGFTCPNRDGSLGTTGCTFCAGEVPPRYQATPDRSWRRPSKESTRTPGGTLIRNEDIPRLVAARLQASSAAIGSGSSSPKE